MTTYQDPPLQSRRAVRQGERAEGQQQPSSPFAPPQVPRTPAGVGEPLSYVTQNRPPLPGYDGSASSAPAQPAAPAQRGRRAAEPSSDGQQPFRPRDYSPEARTAPPAWTPELDRDSGVVEYHTLARSQVVPPQPEAPEAPEADAPAAEAPVAETPAAPVAAPQPSAPAAPSSLAASLAGAPDEHTLTRRELRALREQQGLTQAPVPLVEPAAPSAPQPSAQLDSALAEFDALAGRPAEELTRRAGRRAAAQPYDSESVALPAQPQQHVPPAPQDVAPEPTAAPEPTPAVEPAPMPPAQFTPPAPPAPAPAAPPAAPVAAAPVPSTTGERPHGHWTNQGDLDDRTQVSDSSISRTVGAGSGAITTNALVLPSIPGQDLMTGEVMLTDSVSLPANLAATGAHHSIDESDLDHLLDPGDHQAVNTDSVPIRAIRAVSSHTNSRSQVLATAKPNRGNRTLTALIVSASGMVVVVTTLLVVALLNGGI